MDENKRLEDCLYSIGGRVVDENGPVEDAVVLLEEKGWETETGKYGRFIFHHLYSPVPKKDEQGNIIEPEATYTLKACKDDRCAIKSFKLPLAENEQADFDLVLE